MATRTTSKREQMGIVVVGHVDHGKSSVVGRLLADTHSLPEGKLEQVQRMCRNNARPFEYAFLLDALRDEQAQGITIDSARCFFRTELRDYVIIDAPGHLEFLKNMISGAARADAALLVIDAKEGVRDNSKRHGYMLSLLGIQQVVVLVNKMDLVGYDRGVFKRIVEEYAVYLNNIGVQPEAFIPVSARTGENIASRAPWHDGKTVLEHIDSFRARADHDAWPLRMPVQAVYKFTEQGDARRIVSGTLESGTLAVGDRVVFWPSQKTSCITTIEAFNAPAPTRVVSGQATGVTLADEMYVTRGELMCKVGEPPPFVGARLRARLFWMGKAPMVVGRTYKLKLATSRAQVRLVAVEGVLDAKDLSRSAAKRRIERHAVAECVLETTKQIAFDLGRTPEATGRFVIVDGYEIAGGGSIVERIDGGSSAERAGRETGGERGSVAPHERAARLGHRPRFIVISSPARDRRPEAIGRALERTLFDQGHSVYYLPITNLDRGLDSDVQDPRDRPQERLRRLGEIIRIVTDCGLIVVTALVEVDHHDLRALRERSTPTPIMVVRIGDAPGESRDGEVVLSQETTTQNAVEQIFDALHRESTISDYAI